MEESLEDDDSEEEEEENSSSDSTEPENLSKGRRAKRAATAKVSRQSKPTNSRRKKKQIDDDDEGDVKPTRSSRGKRKKIEESEEDDEEEDKITSENLKEKIQKFNFKKKGENDEENDNSNSKSKKTNSKSKPKKRTKLDTNDENDNSSDSNSGGEQWEVTHVSPTLGNKRPCYAKDGLRKKEKGRRKKSANSTSDKSDAEDEKDVKKSGDEKDDKKSGDENGDEENDDVEKVESEEEKKQEVLRNMSSADRSFRQAGRNSRRCNYEMQACRNILTSLRKHKDAWPYLVPVNLKQAPDYLSIIEKPMDFSLILKNLDDFLYDDALQFIDDVQLIFNNSKKYNTDASLVGETGVRLHDEFQNLLKIHLPEVHATLQT